VAIPVILIPVTFIWYLNVSGIHAVLKEAKEKRLAREKNIASRLAVNK
jgi:hypothetical protein